MSRSAKVREHVPFRLIQMPCCWHFLFWINPRLPYYCPECGAPVRQDIHGSILRSTAGWLELPVETEKTP